MDFQQILSGSDTHLEMERPFHSGVSVQNGYKSYSKGTPILDNFSMTVQKGTIYGLLGASGCGKTTILSCIVGLRHLDSGKIRVFGAKPGTKESGIPGKRLGYMPQDIALYPCFTIKEILKYFGRIYGMSNKEILERINFLATFLHLPDTDKMIHKLSGGQQRRTSLATALIHDPELLILDEPTVGVDPLLRENIWNHLCQLVKRGRTTVIITTHYIEEARQSNMVGLMRNGRLLTEKSPDALLQEHNAILLEEVVLKLCKKDQSFIQGSIVPKKCNQIQSNLSDISFYSKHKIIPFTKTKTDSEYNIYHMHKNVIGLKYKRKYSVNTSDAPHQVKRRLSSIEIVKDQLKAKIDKVKAVIVRNFINFLRNPIFLLGMVISPAFQTTLIAWTVGYDVKDISIGVVNYELPEWKNVCQSDILPGCESQNMKGLSCRYLNTLPKETLNLVSFNTEQEAVDEVKRGNLLGVLTIPANYSKHIVERSGGGNFASNESLMGTILKTRLDMSHYMAAVVMVGKFYQSFETYISELGVECGGNAKEFEIPLKYKEPVYGSLEPEHREYIIPGVLTMLLFIVPLCSSGLVYIADKKLGTMERSRSAGVTTVDFMTGFFVTEGLTIIVQIVLSTTVLVLGFELNIKGSYISYAVLCLLCGLCGQSWGLILGIVCTHETTALLTAFFLYFPMLILTGITWPLEGIPMNLRYFSYILPGTLPTQSMRSIVVRGLGISHPLVWPGFVGIGLWIIFSWIMAFVIYRIKE